MKRNLSLTLAAMIIVAAIATTARAQMFGAQTVRARIPFAFNVGKTSLPAGEYIVTVLNPGSDRRVLQIRSANGRSSAIVQTIELTGHATTNAKLVFHRYGTRYFFAQAQMAGGSTTLAAVKSKAERVEEQTTAKSGQEIVVEIVAD